MRLLRNEVDYLSSERNKLTSFEDYAQDERLRRAIERSLQLAIESCLDIARRLIALRGFRQPETNQEVFQILHAEGVIPAALLPRLLDMARFRNLIVHDYARIDNAIVYDIVSKHLKDFDEFAAVVLAEL